MAFCFQNFRTVGTCRCVTWMAEWQRRRPESQIYTWPSHVGYTCKLGAADDCKMVELLCCLLQDILGDSNWLTLSGSNPPWRNSNENTIEEGTWHEHGSPADWAPVLRDWHVLRDSTIWHLFRDSTIWQGILVIIPQEINRNSKSYINGSTVMPQPKIARICTVHHMWKNLPLAWQLPRFAPELCLQICIRCQGVVPQNNLPTCSLIFREWWTWGLHEQTPDMQTQPQEKSRLAHAYCRCTCMYSARCATSHFWHWWGPPIYWWRKQLWRAFNAWILFSAASGTRENWTLLSWKQSLNFIIAFRNAAFGMATLRAAHRIWKHFNKGPLIHTKGSLSLKWACWNNIR